MTSAARPGETVLRKEIGSYTTPSRAATTLCPTGAARYEQTKPGTLPFCNVRRAVTTPSLPVPFRPVVGLRMYRLEEDAVPLTLVAAVDPTSRGRAKETKGLFQRCKALVDHPWLALSTVPYRLRTSRSPHKGSRGSLPLVGFHALLPSPTLRPLSLLVHLPGLSWGLHRPPRLSRK